ncbi:hypothetical protein PspLS_01101 [Pyricularia sp. CBS 133598]|nr:hypothetical protein PspLS_01101 [Pyricularia sp. CBS 133598]
MTIQSGKGAACLVVLDDVGEIRAKDSSALDPSLFDGLLRVLVAAENKECAKVVRLDYGKVASVVYKAVSRLFLKVAFLASGSGIVRTLNDIVGPGAGGSRLSRELHTEGTLGTVARVCRSRSAEDVDGAALGLTGVVDLDRTVVLCGDEFCRKGGNGARDLVPAAKIRLSVEPNVGSWVEALAVPQRGDRVGDGGSLVLGQDAGGGKEAGEDGFG